jgi:16S rRNA (cytosine1407-C5)-methyltransferase
MRLTLCSPGERQSILKEIERCFGIPPEAFEDRILVVRGKKEVWVASKQALEVELVSWVRTGIPLLRWTKEGFRLTSSAVRAFGDLATRGVVEIPPERNDLAQAFARGEDLPLNPEIRESGGSVVSHQRTVTEQDTLTGQVIVRWRGHTLGSGLVQESRVKNQVPVKMRVRGRR